MSNLYNDMIYDDLDSNDEFLSAKERAEVQVLIGDGDLEKALYMSNFYARPKMKLYRDRLIKANNARYLSKNDKAKIRRRRQGVQSMDKDA